MVGREPYKFWVAAIIGLLIVVVHIGTSAYLWFSFIHRPAYDPSINSAEVTLPLTIAYVVSVVKWFIDTKGRRATDETYGIPLVVLIVLVVGSFLIALPLGPYLYLQGTILEPALLNQYYLFVESVLGAMFALLFGELFGSSDTS
ncbi:MAG: hypothetical protein AAF583_01885 [Pseudomonadota bacterium]